MRDNELQKYLDSWSNFKFYCEDKAKFADCHINNKGWQKLKEYHLEIFLSKVKNPYGFLFKVKYRHRNIFKNVHCMARFYHKYARLKQQELDSSFRDLIKFPSWRNSEKN